MIVQLKRQNRKLGEGSGQTRPFLARLPALIWFGTTTRETSKHVVGGREIGRMDSLV